MNNLFNFYAPLELFSKKKCELNDYYLPLHNR